MVVRILDEYSKLELELEAALEEELDARRKQYEYHRNALLTFPEAGGVRRMAISSTTARVTSGRNTIRTPDGRVPVYGSTGLIGYTTEPSYRETTILVARVGANAGRVNVASGEYDVTDNTLILEPTSDWNVRFAYHQLTNMDLNQYATGGGQPLITASLIKSLVVAVPSKAEQLRIAVTLDTLERMVSDFNMGLSAESGARRRQYEYYRDKLLTFKEAS